MGSREKRGTTFCGKPVCEVSVNCKVWPHTQGKQSGTTEKENGRLSAYK